MKKYIFAFVALMSVMGNSFAENPFNSACRDMSDASVSIMQLRQEGYQQSVLLGILKETTSKDSKMDAETRDIVNTYLSDIVARAYKVPKYNTSNDQKKAAIDFKNLIEKDCEYRLKNLFK